LLKVKNIFKGIVITLLVTFIISINGYSQSNANIGYYVQSKGGFLMAHRSAMSHLVRQNSFGFELGVIKHLQIKETDVTYRHPAIGLNLAFQNFGYNTVLGSAISTSYFFNTPIFQKNDHFIDFQYGLGIAYISEKYDLINNATNNAIGSHFNAKVTLKLLYTKYINRFNLGAGLAFTHYSNGAITYPNLGLNVPSIFLQLGILSNGRKAFQKELVSTPEKKVELAHTRLMGSAIFSIKQVGANPFLPKRYPVFGFRGTIQRQISQMWQAELSLDFIHNEANLNIYPFEDYPRSDVLQIGLFAGAAYKFYRTEIVLGLGYYVRDKINPLGKIYNKIGYRFFFHSKWYGLFNVRANLGKADFFEFGIGYQIKKW